MALKVGTLSVTLEFANDLADKHWFGKQDPYCVLTLGSQKAKSKTHVDGGKNPVWNETFEFRSFNDNAVSIQIFDGEDGKDDFIGSCVISSARARAQGQDRVQVPVTTQQGRQKGILSIGMRFKAIVAAKPQQKKPPRNSDSINLLMAQIHRENALGDFYDSFVE